MLFLCVNKMYFYFFSHHKKLGSWETQKHGFFVRSNSLVFSLLVEKILLIFENKIGFIWDDKIWSILKSNYLISVMQWQKTIILKWCFSHTDSNSSLWMGVLRLTGKVWRSKTNCHIWWCFSPCCWPENSVLLVFSAPKHFFTFFCISPIGLFEKNSRKKRNAFRPYFVTSWTSKKIVDPKQCLNQKLDTGFPPYCPWMFLSSEWIVT